MAQNMEDMQKLGQENVDKAVKTMTTLTKGYQAIAAEMMDYTRKSFEDASAAFEKLQGIRSFDKLVEFQSDYLRATYEAGLARAAKIGEIYSQLVQDSMKPYEAVLGGFNPAKFGFDPSKFGFDPSKFAAFSPAAFGLKK